MEIALWQAPPAAGWADAEPTIRRALGRAAGADLLILPEMFLCGYAIGADAVADAAAHSEAMVARMRALAAASGIGIAFGYPELGPDGIWNAAMMIGKTGETIATCRKTHLFGSVDRAQFIAGDAIGSVADFMGWKIALSICYDIEFPELARAQAQAGADILIVPTANMAPYTGIPLRMVPSRAEENEIFVAYANYTGSEAEFQYCGLSCVVGPDGADRARAGAGAELLRATIDRADIAATRATLSHLRDRRGDLY